MLISATLLCGNCWQALIFHRKWWPRLLAVVPPKQNKNSGRYRYHSSVSKINDVTVKRGTSSYHHIVSAVTEIIFTVRSVYPLLFTTINSKISYFKWQVKVLPPSWAEAIYVFADVLTQCSKCLILILQDASREVYMIQPRAHIQMLDLAGCQFLAFQTTDIIGEKVCGHRGCFLSKWSGPIFLDIPYLRSPQHAFLSRRRWEL